MCSSDLSVIQNLKVVGDEIKKNHLPKLLQQPKMIDIIIQVYLNMEKIIHTSMYICKIFTMKSFQFMKFVVKCKKCENEKKPKPF